MRLKFKHVREMLRGMVHARARKRASSPERCHQTKIFFQTALGLVQGEQKQKSVFYRFLQKP